MRFIDMSKLDVPKDWKQRAQEATDELRRLQPRKRPKFIRKHKNIWKDLKEKLQELSHGKCWYCEIEYTRDDFEIDHFRPKNRIKKYDDPDQTEEGYWWLAFDYRNFRLSCCYCNRPHKGSDGIVRGKAMFFPLCRGSNKCTEDGDLAIERPALLDPADALDPGLLWFDEEGRAVPTFDVSFGESHDRAVKTIDILNLNHFRIKERRRILKTECDTLLNEGDAAYKLFLDESVEGITVLRGVLRRARKLIDDSSPLSRTARVYLLSKNEQRPWIEKILK